MALKIVCAKDEHKDLWDDFVKKQRTSNVYQLYGWKEVIESTYAHRGYYLMAVDGSFSIKGILPIVKIVAYKCKKNFTSIPFFDLGGVLAEDSNIEVKLIEHAIKLAEEENISTICLRQDSSLHSIHRVTPLNYKYFYEKRDKVRLVLKLPHSSEELFSSFKSKLRSQIKRPIKAGLIVKMGKQELVEDFYKVFAQNMKFLGSPVHSKGIITNSVKKISQAKIFTVYKEDVPVAASVVVGFRDTLYNPWASSLREYSRISPNMLLYWSMLKYACDHGFSFFDFGRSTPGEGTYRFKKQWGAEDREIFWYFFSNDKSFSISDSSRIKELFISFWRLLPTPLTIFLGPRIRKYIDL